MSKSAKPARLITRKGPNRSQPIFYLKDGTYERSTGTGNLKEAEKCLAAYLADKAVREQVAEAKGPEHQGDPNHATVSDILSYYVEGHGPSIGDIERLGYSIKTLLPFWANLKMTDINGQVCRRYIALRNRKPATLRRELGVLQAAINYSHKEGFIKIAPILVKPEVPHSEKRYLSRSEMYWFLRGARMLRSFDKQQIIKFIIAGRYTGTRKSVLLNTRLDVRSTTSGYIDINRNLFYRLADDEIASKKRKPTIRLPRQLNMFVKLWAKSGSRFLVDDVNGTRLKDIKKGFATALRNAEQLAATHGQPIDLSGVTPHSLRHTAITWAMQNGANMWDVEGFFGVSAEMVQRVYGHHHPDHQSTALAAMEGRKR